MINKFNLPGTVKNASSATGPFECRAGKCSLATVVRMNWVNAK